MFKRRNVKSLIEKGDKALYKGNLPEAEHCYRQALDIAPDSVEAMYSLGAVAGYRQEYQQAIQLAEDALDIDPEHAGAWGVKGNALLGLERWTEAIEALQRSQPEGLSPVVLGQIGLCHEGLGDFETAEAVLRQALSNDPSYMTRFSQIGMFNYSAMAADLHHFLGRVLQKKGEHKEAKLHYHLAKRNDATIELDPIYREIVSDGELDEYPYIDANEEPPEDFNEHLVWLASCDTLPTRGQFPKVDDQELLDRIAGLIQAAQQAGKYYLSSRLRVLGDVLNQVAPPSLFQALLSSSWRRFFEIVERVNEGKLEEVEALDQISGLSFDTNDTPELLQLTRRFIYLHPESALVLARWVAQLLRFTSSPDHAIQGSILFGYAQSRCRASLAAESTLKKAYEEAVAIGAQRQTLEALIELARHHDRSDEHDMTLAWLDKAVEQGKVGEDDLEAEIHFMRAHLLLRVGRMNEAFDEGFWLLQHAADVEASTRPGALFDLLTELSATTGKKYPLEEMSGLSQGDKSIPIQELISRAQAAAANVDLASAHELLGQAEQSAWQVRDRTMVVQVLGLKAQINAEAEDWEQAENAAAQALHIADQVADQVDTWSLAMLASYIAEQKGDIEQAKSRLEMALREAQRQKDTDKQTESLRALSSILMDSDPERAVQLFGESMRLGSSDEVLPIAWQEAETAIAKEDWPKVIAAYDRLLADDSAEAERLHPEAFANRAIAQIHLGHNKAAMEDFESTAAIYIQRGETIRAIDTLGRVAQLKAQDKEPALPVLEHARELLHREPSPGTRRSATVHLAEAAFETGHLEFAEETAKPALQVAISEDWRDSRDEIRLRHVLAKVARRQGRYPEALKHYNEAVARAEYLNDEGTVAELRGNRAIAQRYMGQLDAAVEDYEYAINFAYNRGNTRYIAGMLYNLSSTLFLLGRYTEAVNAASRAFGGFNALGDVEMADRTLVVLEQYAPAEDLSDELRERIDDLLHSDKPLTDPMARHWRESRKAQDLFENNKPLLGERLLRRIAAEQAAQGDRYNEARTLLALGRLWLPSQSRKAASIAMETRAVAADLDIIPMLAECDELLLQAAMHENDEAAVAQHLPQLLADWRTQRMTLQVDRDRLHLADHSARLLDRLAAWELSKGRPGKAIEAQDLGRGQALLDQVAATMPTSIFPLEKMQALLAHLDEGATMLALAWIDDQLFSFVLDAHDREPHVQDTGLGRTDISRMTATFEREVLRFRAEGAASWERMASPLLSGIEAHLPQKGNVVLVLEEELQSLPLHAVHLSSGECLIERAAVAYAPSMQLLSLLQARPVLETASPGRGLVAAGVTFQDEALALTQRFGGRGLTSRYLNKAELAESFENARFIHMACHGYFDPENHLESGLVIADTLEPMARDVLSTRELMEWGIAADLVVLSACETGRGTASASEFLGLGRALIMAGARSVITALWEVENRATMNLMLDFYRNLFEQPVADAAQALRQAQLHAAQTQGFCEWAAFKLTGWPLYGEIDND